MNEQQLADLFSEQIDQMLLGESVSLPEEAAELQELLGVGQQFSQIEFQAAPVAQAAFQSQIAGWFNAGGGPSAALWGLSKGWFVGLGIAAIVGGIGLGTLLFTNPTTQSDDVDPQNAPVQEIEVLPESTDSNLEQADEIVPATESTEDTKEKSSSAEDTIVPQKPSSLGDKLPVQPPSLGDTIILPSRTPTDTVPAATEENDEIGAGIEDGANGSTDSDDNSASGSDIDDDRGHGNDPGGFDPDNPGQSSGVPDKDSEPDFSRGEGGGSSGGNNGSGGKDNGNNKGKNENRGNGNK